MYTYFWNVLLDALCCFSDIALAIYNLLTLLTWLTWLKSPFCNTFYGLLNLPPDSILTNSGNCTAILDERFLQCTSYTNTQLTKFVQHIYFSRKLLFTVVTEYFYFNMMYKISFSQFTREISILGCVFTVYL